MGYYINPSDGRSKERWLIEEGVACTVTEAGAAASSKEKAPFCLIDNGWMTAAGIAYDEREFDSFSREDGRPKKWYLVELSKLLPFCAKLKERIDAE